jgi:hypothetical protein
VVGAPPTHAPCVVQAAGTQHVHQAYLGHTISAKGVTMDEDKIRVVLDWLVPHTIRAVRTFLSLVGHYRHFIKDFGAIVKPLTKLLRKEGFKWSLESELTFTTLQHALTQAPVLQLPTFNTVFIVECDASRSGIGTILHQGINPIMFFSRPLAPCHSKLAMYKWGLISLM